MDHVYANSDFELSTTGKTRRGSGSPDVSEHTGRSFRERDPPPSKNTRKVLLVALSLLLLCALVALCVLGVLSSQNYEFSAEELKASLDQVQADYENALQHIASLNETVKQYNALKIKFSKVHEVCSTCSGCQTCGLCGENWKRFGVKCYFFSPDFLNWTNSRDHCVKIGGHLAIITSQAEQTFVSTSLGRPHWIGLNDLETEGKWMWVNKQPLTETGVTFWNKGKDGVSEPNNWKEEDPSGENCASLGNENGDFTKWFDASCSKARKYICEK
ncbi:C-type lectin domain family 6 member A-like [Astyanax mexicanus]|uniref:C-type lectin domain family 6 member A-like n=1 Tax=Astyanax mexicanus TaxID=7994 RepID=A0A8T2MCI6_ASTMX|nr:C-type lectin domain family 6 member A-like [Astyanax mexicanus]